MEGSATFGLCNMEKKQVTRSYELQSILGNPLGFKDKDPQRFVSGPNLTLSSPKITKRNLRDSNPQPTNTLQFRRDSSSTLDRIDHRSVQPCRWSESREPTRPRMRIGLSELNCR